MFLTAICSLALAIALGAAQTTGTAQDDQSDRTRAEAQATVLAAREKAERASQEVAERARNDRDLAAQEGMATAAKDQLAEIQRQTLSLWLSVILGGAATIISIFALLVSMQTNRRQLAAHVLPENGNLIDGRTVKPMRPDRYDWPGASLLIKNFGPTPALNARGWMNMVILPTGAEHLIPPIQGVLGGSPIPPNHPITRTVDLGRKLTAEEKAGLKAGTMTIYVYGQFLYVDIFNRQRFSNLRLSYTGFWPPLPGHSLYFCIQGNETDSDRKSWFRRRA